MALIGPLPSIGSPSAFTTRPSSALPTGTEAICCVRLTVSPSRMSLKSPMMATPTLSSSRLSTRPFTPFLNSTSSPDSDALQAVDAGDAVAQAEHGAGLGNGDLLAVVLDLLADDSADLVGADFHGLVCRGRECFGDAGRCALASSCPRRQRRPGCLSLKGRGGSTIGVQRSQRQRTPGPARRAATRRVAVLDAPRGWLRRGPPDRRRRAPRVHHLTSDRDSRMEPRPACPDTVARAACSQVPATSPLRGAGTSLAPSTGRRTR